ncbi:MAG: O-antigen ligase family protein [Thermoanaerobaculia bacterium]
MRATRPILPDLPASPAVRIAALAYLAHLLCEGWIGSSEAFLGIALVAAVVAWKRGELTVPFHPLYVPLAIFVAASVVSAAASFRPFVSLLNANEWFGFLTLPLALALYSRFPQVRRYGVGALLALVLFQSAVGATQFLFLGHDALEKRITGTTAHVMTYSGIVLPLSLLFLSLGASRLRRPLYLLAAAAGSLAVALSFTRGAWLGWMVGVLVLVLLRRPRAMVWLVPVLILAITFSPLPLFARLVSSFDFRQTSVLDRIRMVEGGIEIIRDRPLLGVGPANVKEIYPLYRKDDAPRFRIPHLHSNPVQLWAERGVLALAAYLALQVLFLAAMLARRRDPDLRPWAEAGIATALALFVAGLFEFNFGDTEVLLTSLDIWALALLPPPGPAANPQAPPVVLAP